MIIDGKPAHWPKMVDQAPADEQGATRALAEVRRMIVAYRKAEADGCDEWRIEHAQTDAIVNVVGGLIADAEAYLKMYQQTDEIANPLRDRIKKLEEDLAESKRPFTAQMEMQNRRIIDLNAQVLRLEEALAARSTA